MSFLIIGPVSIVAGAWIESWYLITAGWLEVMLAFTGFALLAGLSLKFQVNAKEVVKKAWRRPVAVRDSSRGDSGPAS